MTAVIAPARSRQPRSRRRDPRDRRSLLLTALVWLGVAYFLLPLLWLAIASTKDNADLFTTFGFAFGGEFNFINNLVDLFEFRDGAFWRWTLNTVVYAGVSAVGATALATAAGYAFAKFAFPGRQFIFGAVLGSIMIPATALALPTYLVFANLGLVNTPWAIIIPSIVSPFGVYLMRVYAADSVPDSLIEAARIDGASETRIFFSIGVRLMAPGMVTVFLFSLVGVWNNFFLPLIMLSSSELYPLTVGLAQLNALSTGGGGSTAVFSTVITGSFISIVPLVVAFLYLQRYWQSGLAAGSTKE
jgi:multiple sugar transport system permease protein